MWRIPINDSIIFRAFITLNISGWAQRTLPMNARSKPHIYHPDHGRQPPISCPNPTKPHQYHHECLCDWRRRRRHRFGRYSHQNHNRGHQQVNESGDGVVFHLRTEGKGHKRPHNNTQWHNNQSGCGRGYAGVVQTEITATISRNGEGNNAKIQQLLWTIAAAVDGNWTQQPTGSTVKYKNERMRRVGEEGGITSNTTINQSGWYCYFLFCCLWGLVLSVID